MRRVTFILTAVCLALVIAPAVRAQDASDDPSPVDDSETVAIPKSAAELRTILGIGEASDPSVSRLGIPMSPTDAQRFDAWAKDWRIARNDLLPLVAESSGLDLPFR